MLGKAALLEPNITGFSRDFKRARYQKLAFVEICIYVRTFVDTSFPRPNNKEN